jgi:putative transposase
MGLPRSKYVREGEEGVYHCFSRCVRRAFLCGYDAHTGRDFSHRKKWAVDRLRFLASIFAVEVCAYAIMENHLHAILRTRPDITARWSDSEVATRWKKLCPQKRRIRRKAIPPIEEQVAAMVDYPDRISILRKRLCSVSWFMGQLDEFIARAANKEDRVKGRFWEGRFKCQELLDETAVVACMVYVDLNLIRAGVAATPEESHYTSIKERIREWHMNKMAAAGNWVETTRAVPHGLRGDKSTQSEAAAYIPDITSEHVSTAGAPIHSTNSSDSWLCPIQSDSRRRGILQMTSTEYFDLLDKSGRMVRSDKRGVIDADLEPILKRVGATPKAWVETVTDFGSLFCLVAGKLGNMRSMAVRLNKCWFKGMAAAQRAFA